MPKYSAFVDSKLRFRARSLSIAGYTFNLASVNRRSRPRATSVPRPDVINPFQRDTEVNAESNGGIWVR
jgi:hypothetical protein